MPSISDITFTPWRFIVLIMNKTKQMLNYIYPTTYSQRSGLSHLGKDFEMGG